MGLNVCPVKFTRFILLYIFWSLDLHLFIYSPEVFTWNCCIHALKLNKYIQYSVLKQINFPYIYSHKNVKRGFTDFRWWKYWISFGSWLTMFVQPHSISSTRRVQTMVPPLRLAVNLRTNTQYFLVIMTQPRRRFRWENIGMMKKHVTFENTVWRFLLRILVIWKTSVVNLWFRCQ